MIIIIAIGFFGGTVYFKTTIFPRSEGLSQFCLFIHVQFVKNGFKEGVSNNNNNNNNDCNISKPITIWLLDYLAIIIRKYVDEDKEKSYCVKTKIYFSIFFSVYKLS